MILEKRLEVPYHSQFLEVEDYFWNIRSCGGTCIKMCLDYFSIPGPSILEIMNEAFNTDGYHAENGFAHNFALNYFKENNLNSYRKEDLKNMNEIIISLDNNNPVIASIIKNTLEQTKYHLIVVVGYKYTLEENKDSESIESEINKIENKKVTHIIYHEPESTDASRGAYRECDIETFQKYWRGKAIFVSLK